MSFDFDFDGFAKWLEAMNYRQATRDNSLYDAKLIVEGRTDERFRYVARRMLAFLGPNADSDLVSHLQSIATPAKAAPNGIRGGRKTKQRRQKDARSFADDEWAKLCAQLDQEESIEAAVLGLMAATGLRIGDVLRLTRSEFEHALKTGTLAIEQKGGEQRFLRLDGAPEAWAKLADFWKNSKAHNVALLVSPRGDGSTNSRGAAYRKVLRALKSIAEDAGISSRAYTHRFRRTVGVQALRITEDLVAVQQLLGHRSLASTMHYIDEARPDRVAELQQQIRNRFRGGSELVAAHRVAG